MLKRGMSEVVTSVIMIVLVLAAIAVVWAVINNILTEKSKEVSLENFNTNIEIKSAKIEGGQLKVNIRRGPGEGELKKVNLVVSDGVNSEVIERSLSLKELEETTIIINGNETDIIGVSEISIAKKSSEGEISPTTDKIVINSKEDKIKKLDGLVSWWRFEGNANDEMGLNNGTITGVNCNIVGKFGKACKFNRSAGDWIRESNNESDELHTIDNFTISAWTKLETDFIGATNYDILINGELCAGGNGFDLRIHKDSSNLSNQNRIEFTTCALGGGSFVYSNPNTYSDGIWHHIVATKNETIGRIYFNGNEVGYQSQGSLINYNYGKKYFSIGGKPIDNQLWNGSIDEVMIFNRSLTSTEIQQLYNLEIN